MSNPSKLINQKLFSLIRLTIIADFLFLHVLKPGREIITYLLVKGGWLYSINYSHTGPQAVAQEINKLLVEKFGSLVRFAPMRLSPASSPGVGICVM